MAATKQSLVQRLYRAKSNILSANINNYTAIQPTALGIAHALRRAVQFRQEQSLGVESTFAVPADLRSLDQQISVSSPFFQS